MEKNLEISSFDLFLTFLVCVLVQWLAKFGV